MSAISQASKASVQGHWLWRACGAWVNAALRLGKAEKAGQSLLLLTLRIVGGLGLVMAGWGKFGNMEGSAQFFSSLGIPAAGFSAGLVASVELVGGALLILGLGTRLAALPVIATMGVAMITAHGAEIVNLKSFLAQSPSPYLAIGLVLLAFGPGAVSIDRWLKRISKRCVEPGA